MDGCFWAFALRGTAIFTFVFEEPLPAFDPVSHLVKNIDSVFDQRLLPADHFEKIAFFTSAHLLCKGSLDFTAAQGAGNDPADTAAVFPTMDAIGQFLNRRGTGSQRCLFGSAGFAAALLVFPAIDFVRHVYPSRQVNSLFNIPPIAANFRYFSY
jgi:hypothetical protein